MIRRTDTETLTEFAEAVAPLFAEINVTLDELTQARRHPLPDDQTDLEVDLNSLAQAAMEARMEASSRRP